MALRNHRILGLDTLRFACALWVVLHHGARPEIATWLGWSEIAREWNDIAFDGVAAVIVFFVISGLVIHFPFAGGDRLKLLPFYANRFIRIGIPLLLIRGVVWNYGAAINADVAHASGMVVWSLWCELIYYAIYPFLLIGFRKFGLPIVIACAVGAASALIVLDWYIFLYANFSKIAAAIAGLPVWLLGCAIAQRIADGTLPKLPGSIWVWRAGALLLSIPPKALVYPAIAPILIGNPTTLSLFAIYVYFWMMKEIATFDAVPPPKLTEWGGRWSYSIYLVHCAILVALASVPLPVDPFLRSALQITAVLIASYAFYLLFERPAQLLAGFAGRWLAPRGTGTNSAPGDVVSSSIVWR